ncbi:photosystem I assembly protein Ycf3 [Anatilimnocola aggregata]|uniref:Photosystem I assembly protein Ycf3 n=1 Tax=Anatilimnocola aggregata TaxID=2528021 RepID=A0A517YGY4_9BACT|nr:tetratricopeptide repeat protein [Anatilimnocola aggregata]QDU29442.1 photosystem I assembly protein Ycf3 [Anatilimnocola aggregata]
MYRLLLSLVASIGFASAALLSNGIAADGYLVTVTAATAQIKSEQTVLGTVQRGTRLWVFEEKGDWIRVKVPGQEEKGWISAKQAQRIQFTAAQREDAKLANAHWGRGLELEKQQKLAEARREFEQCLVLERSVHGDHPNVADTLNSLGILTSDQGDYPAARKYYEEALVVYRKVLGNEHKSTAGTLNNLGILASDQGDYPAARKYYEEALAIQRKELGNEHPSTADTLSNLGVLARGQGDYPAARKYCEEALVVYRKVLGNEHKSTAGTLNNLGVLVSDQGDYPAARKYYEEALAIQRKVLGNEHPSTADTLSNLGVLARGQGDYPAARKYCEEALVVYRKVLGNEHTSTARTLNNLGVLVSDQGDYPAARKYYEEALVIKRKVLGNEHTSTADTLNNLGVLVSDQGDYSAARKYYEEALAIQRKVLGNEHPSTADTLNNLGILVQNQGDYPAARKYYEEALVVYRKVLGNEHTSTAETLNNLGILASDQGDYPAARKYYEEALVIKRKVLGNEHTITASTLINLAWLAADETDPSAAIAYLDQARRAIRFHEVRTLPGLSEAEQLAFLRNMHDKDWHNSLSWGRSERTTSRISEISAAWLVNGKGISEESLATGIQLEKPETAALVAQLRTLRGKLADIVRQPQSDERDRRQAELAAEQQRLVRLLGQARGEDLTSDPWVDIAGIRKAIPAKTMLVNTARLAPYNYKTKKRGVPLYVAWLIPSAGEGDVKIVDLGEAEAIDAAVTAFRKAMDEAGAAASASKGEKEAQAAVEKTLASVADLIWKPLAEHLADKEELILSPDAALWLVPWGALPVEDGKFLIEKYNLKYVISGRELVTKKADKPAGKSVVLADPDFDLGPSAATPAETTKLARRSITRLDRAQRLPGTAKEAEAIAPSLKTYSKRDPIVYLNREATESQFKQLVSPQVLVLGTHGFFFPQQEVETQNDDRLQLIGQEERRSVRTKDGQPLENPLLRCGVLLAGCNRPATAATTGLDDGVLTGLEIVNADLRGTELVVLSACQTGLGDVRSGEGVAGLRQAFQLAGAKAVVSTLWQIPDDESAQLMGDFFGYLAEGKSKAEALRFAQLNRIVEHREREGSAPAFYWGAYTLTE